MTNSFAVSPEQKAAGLADRDSLHRFLFDTKPAQGLWVNVNQAINDSLEHQQDYPDVAKRLLGELMLIAALMRHNLKHPNANVLLGIHSQDTPIRDLRVDVTADSCRAFCRVADDVDFSKFSADAKLSELVNPEAFMQMTIRGVAKVDQNSIVPINLDSIEESIKGFYKQSVQLPVDLKIASEFVDGKVNASALFMQFIPDDSGSLEEFEDLTVLMDSLTPDELLSLSCNDTLYRLFNQEDLKVQFDRKLKFECYCSPARMLGLLATLPEEDIDEAFKNTLEETGAEKVEMTCQVCGRKHGFSREDVNAEKLARKTLENLDA